MMYSADHYDAFWKAIIKALPKGGSYRFDMRDEGYNIIKDTIPEGSKVFDYACGLGIISIKLSKEKDCSVYGCDWSAVAVEYVNMNITKGEFRHTDEIFGGKYDYIIVSHFLEHLEKPVEFLSEVFKHTDKAIISLPNNFRHVGEHVNMQWSNWAEFNNLFSDYDIERIDEGKYTSKTQSAWQHPIFIFKEKNMHPSYREEKKEKVIKKAKKIVVKQETAVEQPKKTRKKKAE